MDPFQVRSIDDRLREPLRAALRGERAEWPALTGDDVRALVDHGVAPLVYRAQPLPELRNAAIRVAAVEPLRHDDLVSVLDALAAHGVDVLITKGTALAYDIYAAPELRPRGDVDLLVARGDAAKAIAALRAIGFVEHLSSGDEHGNRQVSLTRVDETGMAHEYDLHWEITNTPVFANALRFEDLLPRSIPLPQLGPHARGLSFGDALLYACIHRVAHHYDSERLIWLVDIALLRERMTRDEHARFWRQAADARVVAVCARSIELAEAWASARAPHDLAAEFLTPGELARDEPSQAFLNRDRRYGALILGDLRALPWRSRLQRLWQLAFPPADFVRQSFGAEGSRTALPWLYVRRGARSVRRLFRRVS